LKSVKHILQILAALSFIELAFNAPVLLTSRDDSIHWDMPVVAFENDEDIGCVVDKYWTRLTVLNPDKTVRSVISTGYASTIAPDGFSEVALDDRYVYLLDKVKSKNGTSVISERVLKYDLDGQYVSTEYDDTGSSHDARGYIRSLKVYDGNLFILKTHGDSAYVLSIVDGIAVEVMRCSFPGSPIRHATYQPEISAVTASTMNGKAFLFRDGVTEEVRLSDRTSIISNMVIMPDGVRYILDQKNGLLVRQAPDLSETVVCRSDAVWLWYNAPSGSFNHLFLCDDADNTVTSISLPYHRQSVSTSAGQPFNHLVKWYLTWFSLIVLALVLLYYLSLFIVRTVKHRIPTRKAEEDLHRNGLLSPAVLYGKPALFIITSFLITGILLSVSSYRIMLDHAVSSTFNIASSISSISGETIGDAVKMLDSPDDYGSRDYISVCNFCETFCSGEDNTGFDLLFDLYRLNPDTGNLYYVIDHAALNALGTEILQKRLENFGLNSYFKSVTAGEHQSFKLRTGKGLGTYCALAPIYDSFGQVTGAVLVFSDLDAVKTHSKEAVLTILLRAFSLLSVLIMLFVELKLIREFLKVRKLRFISEGRKVTICEGHRELRIVTRLPFYLLVPFIAPYARQLAIESGINGDPGMLAALPLSIYGLLMVFGGMFMSIFTKRNPGRSINIGSVVTLAVGALLLFNHLYFKNYSVLVAALSVLGLTSALTIAACKSIRLFDIRPDKRYSKLVYTNMEPPVYASMGAVLGSLVYDSLGFAAVIAVFALVCIAAIILSKLFIAPDINIAVCEEKDEVRENRMMNVRYFMRMDVIGLVLFVAVPAGFLMQYTSFMLPMFNEKLGNTVLLVGFLTLMTKILPIPVSPNIIFSMKEKSVSSSVVVSLSALALAFFAFALRPTMVCLAVMLFVLGIFHPVIQTLIERYQIESAKKYGINPSDANGIFTMASCVGDFAGPLCLAAMMVISDSAVGVISGSVSVLCILGVLLTFRKKSLLSIFSSRER